MMFAASSGTRHAVVAMLLAAGLCCLPGIATAAGEAILLTADFGRTTYGGSASHYDALALEHLAGAGLDATLGNPDFDPRYTQHRPRSFGMRWQNSSAALEIGYFNLGRASYAASGQVDVGGGPTDLATNLTTKSHGPALSIIAILPFGGIWQLEGRGGAYYGRTRTTWSATVDGSDTYTGADGRHELSPLAGAALVVDAGRQSALSLGFTRFFDVANRHVDRLSLGVSVVLRER